MSDGAACGGSGLQLREAMPADFDAILALNQASVHFLSPMDRSRLATLHQMAAYRRVIARDGCVRAFLLAMREGSAYDSLNYRWIAERFDRFLYIDRVVIAGEMQGQGLGRMLYADLVSFARGTGVTTLTCEVDEDPPNPVSQRFHAAFGFRPVGHQRVGAAGKRVAFQALTLEAGIRRSG